jgi:hypothetical protein
VQLPPYFFFLADFLAVFFAAFFFLAATEASLKW